MLTLMNSKADSKYSIPYMEINKLVTACQLSTVNSALRHMQTNIIILSLGELIFMKIKFWGLSKI